MASFPGARVVVLLCFLVHFVFSVDWIAVQANSVSVISGLSLVQGITLLLYPLLGILADTHFNRFRFIKISIILLFLNSFFFLILFIVFNIEIKQFDPALHNEQVPWYLTILFVLILVIIIISVGMFDAVGIQFGMDQMVEASSDQISAFTHWYYWSMNIGIGIQALVMMCGLFILGSCTVQAQVDGYKFVATYVLLYAYFLVLALQLLATFAVTLSLYKLKKHLTIEPAIHLLLHFLCTNSRSTSLLSQLVTIPSPQSIKCSSMPGSTSALRDAVPSPTGRRIFHLVLTWARANMEPFTTEEVEDVKTFLLLSLVLASLFGFHLADNGYSVVQQLNYKLCPSAIVQASVSLSPNILQTVTVMVCVPTLHFVLLPRLLRRPPPFGPYQTGSNSIKHTN